MTPLTTVRAAAAIVTLLMLALLPSLALGHDDDMEEEENIDFDRPEAWAMKYFAAVGTMTGMAAPKTRDPWSVELAFELDWIPSLSEEERQVGFDGTKVEDLNKLPLLARPRVMVGLPAGFAAELGWIPPLEVNGVETNLLSLALERPLLERERFALGLRASGATGRSTGDFTCSEEVASQPPGEGNPYGCLEPSRDANRVRTVGLAVTGGVALGSSGSFHFAVGATYNDLEFDVDALMVDNEDHTQLSTNGWTGWSAVGVGWPLSDSVWLGGELFYSPLDVVRPPSTDSQNDPLLNVRTVLRYRFR